MTANRIALEIITPERLLLRKEIDSVTIPGFNGELGILTEHTALISQLSLAGLVNYQNGNESGVAFVSQGFVEVLDNKVTILAEQAELPEEIDINKAKIELQEAEKIVKSAEKDGSIDMDIALASLDSAMVKVQVAERNATRR